MKKIFLAFCCSTFLFAGKNVVPAAAEPVNVPTPAPAMPISSHAIDLKIGTLGVGMDIEHMFNKKFGVRFNINGGQITRHKTYDDIYYDAKLKLFSAGILADYHPWGGIFRITTGLYYNRNKITATATPTGSVEIGNETFTNVVDVDAKIEFNKLAPYIGIGWSSVEHNGWHFVADIGVMYSGRPKVHIKATSSDPTIQSQLDSQARIEEQNVYNDVKKYKFWPVISIGIQKRF